MRCRIAADTKRKSRYLAAAVAGLRSRSVRCSSLRLSSCLLCSLGSSCSHDRSSATNTYILFKKNNANTYWNDKVHIFLTTWMVLINNRRLSTMKWTLKGKIKSYDIKLGNKSIKYPLGIVNFKEIDSFYLGTRTCHKLLFVSRGSIWYSH